MVVFDILLRASWRGGGANWVKCRRRRRRRQNGRFASGGAAEWESGMSSVGTRRRNVDHGGIASSCRQPLTFHWTRPGVEVTLFIPSESTHICDCAE